MKAVGSPHAGEGTRRGVGLQEGPTASRPTYRLIQILRGLAALMVVAHHATIMLWERVHLPVANWIAGSSGVDLFFVISGFVMTVSSRPLEKTEHPARTFLARRLERIVPLYWLVTTLKIITLLAVPGIALNGLGSLHHVITSYLFYPSLSAEGRFEPVVVVGWTLNFEMAFYALFALALAARWRPLWLLAPLLILIPLIPFSWLAGWPVATYFYDSTVMWEFCFGMILGTLVHRVRRLPLWLGLLLLVAGLCPLLAWNAPGVSWGRGVLWGVPATAVVTGVLAMESRLGALSPRWMLEMGDASYSIYLVHTFTLPAIGYWLSHWPHRSPEEIVVAMLAAVSLSALSGEMVYRVVERPLMAWFKGRRRTAVPANA